MCVKKGVAPRLQLYRCSTAAQILHKLDGTYSVRAPEPAHHSLHDAAAAQTRARSSKLGSGFCRKQCGACRKDWVLATRCCWCRTGPKCPRSLTSAHRASMRGSELPGTATRAGRSRGTLDRRVVPPQSLRCRSFSFSSSPRTRALRLPGQNRSPLPTTRAA
jgi:hypothetical protein